MEKLVGLFETNLPSALLFTDIEGAAKEELLERVSFILWLLERVNADRCLMGDLVWPTSSNMPLMF